MKGSGYIFSDRARRRIRTSELLAFYPRPYNVSWILVCAVVAFGPFAQTSVAAGLSQQSHAAALQADLAAHRMSFRRHLSYAVAPCPLYADDYNAAALCEARSQRVALR